VRRAFRFLPAVPWPALVIRDVIVVVVVAVSDGAVP